MGAEDFRGIAHDLRTALGGAFALSQLLVEGTEPTSVEQGKYAHQHQRTQLPPDQYETLFLLYDQLAVVLGMLERVLSSGPHEEEHESCRVQTVVNDLLVVLKPFLPERFSAASPDMECGVPYSILLRILLNLLSNSIKYNSGPQSRTVLEWHTHEEWCVFHLVDTCKLESASSVNGPLMKRSERMPWYAPSLGIGLSIITTLITQYGGVLEYDFTGTHRRFTVLRLPCKRT